MKKNKLKAIILASIVMLTGGCSLQKESSVLSSFKTSSRISTSTLSSSNDTSIATTSMEVKSEEIKGPEFDKKIHITLVGGFFLGDRYENWLYKKIEKNDTGKIIRYYDGTKAEEEPATKIATENDIGIWAYVPKQEQEELYFKSLLDKLGVEYFVSPKITKITLNDDLTIAGLEVPFSENKSDTIQGNTPETTLKGDPNGGVILQKNGIDVVDISNPTIVGNNYDQETNPNGVNVTKETLESLGIEYFYGKNFQIKEFNGIKVGIVGIQFNIRDISLITRMMELLKKESVNYKILYVNYEYDQFNNLYLKTEYIDKFLEYAKKLGYDLIVNQNHRNEALPIISSPEGYQTDKGVIVINNTGTIVACGTKEEDNETRMYQLEILFKDGEHVGTEMFYTDIKTSNILGKVTKVEKPIGPIKIIK